MRELRNLIERSVIPSGTRVPEVAFPSLAVSEAGAATTLEEAESRHIRQALERSGWRIRGPRGAAERLGLNRGGFQAKYSRSADISPQFPHVFVSKGSALIAKTPRTAGRFAACSTRPGSLARSEHNTG